MAYIKNEELKAIKKALYNGTTESISALAIIYRLERKQRQNAQRTWNYIKDKRTTDKDYARPKKRG